MFPSEMVILMAIELSRDSDKNLLKPMGVAGEYVNRLCDSLIRRGYLKKNSLKGYRLTSMGREALLGFLHENTTRARDTVKALKRLGIEISQEQEQKIDKLEKKAIKVN